MSLHFASDWPPAFGWLLAGILAGAAWLLYRPIGSIQEVPSYARTLPALRALSVFLIALTLVEPVWESQVREGEPGKIVFVLDGSESMTWNDNKAWREPAEPERSRPTRFDRATELLVAEDSGLIPQLSHRFDIAVRRIADGGSLETLWASKEPIEDLIPSSMNWKPATWTTTSSIGEAIRELAAGASSGRSQESREVVVLLSDGQSNSGLSPIEASQHLGGRGIPAFTVGFGAQRESDDVAIRAATAPQRVFVDDTLSGNLRIAEHLNAGVAYTAEVSFEGTVLWTRDLVSQGLTSREVEFSFPVGAVLDAAKASLQQEAEFVTLPVKLDVRLNLPEDFQPVNNSSAIYTMVTARPSRILLIDGRSRWETRYLKNMFTRDPAWDITTGIGRWAGSSQVTLKEFPQTQEELFRYHLVILGEIPDSAFQSEQLDWLREFVELRGGGLILLDGARGYLRESGYRPLQDLLPIRWTGVPQSAAEALPKQAVLTPAGQGANALRLADESPDDTAPIWSRLPPVQFVAQVEALEGSEVLANALSDLGRTPLLVTRRFGAGRVLYVATDEMWKWRYKVADRFHTRLWNQLARWVMRTPLSVQGEFISLDTGAASYQLGQSVEIRCQLRQTDGSPASGQAATAVVRRQSQIVARVPLIEDTNVPGSYRATADTLAAGDYQVEIEAAGFPQSALRLESKFSMLASENLEWQAPTCNAELLEKIAETTGGCYVHEGQVDTLAELLQPLSGGTIRRSATMIWQSYWWFGAAMGLLTVEWVLRKRAGLV